MAFRSLGRIVGKHPCQKCTNQHPATHTLPSARGTEDFVNNIDFWEMLTYFWGSVYMYIWLNIYMHIYIFMYVCSTNTNSLTKQYHAVAQLTRNIWFLACFCIAKMVDPKHRLGVMFFQPTFLSSISTVFSHQKVIPEMYIYIYIYLYGI